MTQLLSKELDQIGEQGLSYNIGRAKEILSLQKSIDEEKSKILKQLEKHRK